MNGQIALNVINNYENLYELNKSRFDFIFLDLHMPVLDGFQVISKVLNL